MTYQTAEARFEAIDAVLTLLRGKETAVLTTHINADGKENGPLRKRTLWMRPMRKTRTCWTRYHRIL